MSTNVPGKAPYVNDATRKWADTYRVNNVIKPALVFRASTDSNYINDQLLQLPVYGNNWVNARSICNVVSPGQRIPGILSWSVSESLDNIVQSAQLTVLDALPQSRVTTTVSNFATGTKGAGNIVTQSTLPAQWHSTRIRYHWVQNGNGISTKLVGNKPIKSFTDPTTGQPYQEGFLQYRIFEPEVIVGNFSSFPNPAVPAAENEGTNEWWDVDTFNNSGGVGAYYVLIGTEVMRVTQIERIGGNSDRMYIVPGGRGAAGFIQQHNIGDTVTLLGFPPYSGLWAGFGYLMPKDFRSNLSPFRPGTCYVSYEGYGNPGDYTHPNGTGPFSVNSTGPTAWKSKQFDRQNNMCFTGYWFTESPQVTLDSTGVPQLTITLQSAGYVLTEQKIDPFNIQRAKTTLYSWSKSTFDQVGYQRKIPGDWFDYNMWDPSLPNSYPLTIATEYAQNQDFFNHMADTDMGKRCQYCQQEWLDYVKQHEHGKPTGSIQEARAVGKHIYKESIRVFNKGGQFNAGPIKTFGRLMTALAIAAWENPLQGNELGTRWTKMPQQLFSNMGNWTNGRVWNGQLAFDVVGGTKNYDWSNDAPQDKAVYGTRLPLKSPFKSQYDRQPWSQPMLDLADVNRMTYTLSREGYPIFAPVGKKLRGVPNPGIAGTNTPFGKFIDSNRNETADNDNRLGEWILSYGGSIDSYTHTIDPSVVLTLVYVSCQTAFGEEITFTIPAAGTGIQVSNNKNNNSTEKVVMYSNVVGNKDGLQLTSGTQQTDEVSLDNLLLGLDWNTDPASWGLTVKRGADGLTQVDSQPPIPNPNGLALYYESRDSKLKRAKKIVSNIQKFIFFMEQRRYIGPAVYDNLGQIIYAFGTSTDGDGVFGKATDAGVKNVQQFFLGQNLGYTQSGIYYKFVQGTTTYQDQPGVWGPATYSAAKKWMSQNAEYIKTDVWWYVQNGLPWEQYIGAITGMPIPQRRDDTNPQQYIIDQQALKTEAEQWMKQFFKDAVNYGNAVVDDSINKATQKVLSSNLADPRIQLGDVIWAEVPGYLSKQNVFNQSTNPFLNGIYVTGITRSLDLREGTYTATYSGYRYRGNFESVVSQNPNNFCSISTQV